MTKKWNIFYECQCERFYVRLKGAEAYQGMSVRTHVTLDQS